MTRKASWASFAAAALITAGCATATVGTDFDWGATARLVPGHSSLADASAAFGRPPNAMMQVGATTHYTWSFVQSKATAGLFSTDVKTQSKSVTLEFSSDGIMRRAVLASNGGMPVSAAATTAQFPATRQAPAVQQQAAREPLQLGRDGWQADKAVRGAGCGSKAQASLTSRGPGFELYSATCIGGDVMKVRCEMGSCTVVQ